MTTENQIPMIYSKMSSILSDIEAVAKNRKNANQGYAFRGIDDFLNACNPVLAKHKVFFTRNVIRVHHEKLGGDEKGMPKAILTSMTVRTNFYAEDGSCVSDETEGMGMDYSGDKSANKAMSAALKYALVGVFCIPTENLEDSDGDEGDESEEMRVKAESFDRGMEWGKKFATQIKELGWEDEWTKATRSVKLETMRNIRESVMAGTPKGK